MAARKRSLRDLAAKSRKDGLAAANTGPVAGRIAELDPELVHTGGLADRFDVSQAEIATLAESLCNAGQKVPILVRPHPERPVEYEIIAGRRRLAACRNQRARRDPGPRRCRTRHGTGDREHRPARPDLF